MLRGSSEMRPGQRVLPNIANFPYLPPMNTKLPYYLTFILLLQAIQALPQSYLLQPDRVFNGTEMHPGWQVWVKDGIIQAAGPPKIVQAPREAEVIDLKGMTLMPGIIEGHSHILLHPYNETSWNEQVLNESYAERAARATVHVRKSLEAGITTMRDLGSEGADYVDVGIRTAIEKGVIPGPRLLVAGRAIVATGSYGPKGFAPHVQVPLGAEPADGADLVRVVRDQIGHGADVVKVYADYRWGPNDEAMPTFSIDELTTIVETAKSSGRPVSAHAATAEGMRRATLAGVYTIEHGDGGTKAVFELMAEKGVALCPTIAAGEAISGYKGWRKGIDPDPARVVRKKQSIQMALEAGVIISFGGDVGVFTHGENVWEMELMVAYGMKPLQVLQSATSVNAQLFGLDQLGQVKMDYIADLIAVEGDPLKDIQNMRLVKFVMQNGNIFLNQMD